MQIPNPFHPGELLIQKLAGEVEGARQNGHMVSDVITEGALPFLREQQMLIVGSSSPDGSLWASILFGPRGFVESEDGKNLNIHLGQDARDDLDPFWKNAHPGTRIGTLAVDLATRRRLRINGRLTAIEPDFLTATVEEAYPNCPKYIQRRLLRLEPIAPPRTGLGEGGDTITSVVRAIIEGADTLFVASSNPHGGTDASHRGGHPGFVTVMDERTLTVPDYRGNSMFTALGNIYLNPPAGILIVDFAGHRTLQLTGEAHVHWDRTRDVRLGTPTGRSWTLRVARWLLRPLPVVADWEFVDSSPYNPR